MLKPQNPTTMFNCKAIGIVSNFLTRKKKKKNIASLIKLTEFGNYHFINNNTL